MNSVIKCSCCGMFNNIPDFNLPEDIIVRSYLRVIGQISDIKKYIKTINEVAVENNINPNLLLGFIAVENANRKKLGFIENLLVKLFPYWVVKLDLSLGISQLKVSTLVAELNLQANKIALAKKLINHDFNIRLCAKLLSNYCTKQMYGERKFEFILRLVKLYTTGKENVENYPWIILYAIIITKMMRDNLFEKLIG